MDSVLEALRWCSAWAMGSDDPQAKEIALARAKSAGMKAALKGRGCGHEYAQASEDLCKSAGAALSAGEAWFKQLYPASALLTARAALQHARMAQLGLAFVEGHQAAAVPSGAGRGELEDRSPWLSLPHWWQAEALIDPDGYRRLRTAKRFAWEAGAATGNEAAIGLAIAQGSEALHDSARSLEDAAYADTTPLPVPGHPGAITSMMRVSAMTALHFANHAQLLAAFVAGAQARLKGETNGQS